MAQTTELPEQLLRRRSCGPWPGDPDATPAPVLDELEVVRRCRRGRHTGIRVTLSDGRELTVTVEQTEPPRAAGRGL